MGYFRYRLILLFTIIYISIFLIPHISFAQSISRFSLDNEKKIEYVDAYLDKIHIEEKEIKTDSTIQTYDINESGEIILGFSEGEINLYNGDGTFSVAFRHGFESSYALQFYGENILLYYTKSGSIIEFTKKGEVINVWEGAKSSINDEISSQMRDKNMRRANGNIYIRGYFPTKFTKEDSDGQISIIYQGRHMIPMEAMYTFVLMMVGFIVFSIQLYSRFRKK